jgi:hypothetical protein
MSIASIYIQSLHNTSIKNQFEQLANQTGIFSFVLFFSFSLDPLLKNENLRLRGIEKCKILF